MSDLSELVAAYYFGGVDRVQVYAIYASAGDYETRTVDWYDCYDENGVCLNEGAPWWSLPTWHDCFHMYYSAKKEVST